MTCIQLHKEYTVYVIIQIPFDTAVKSYEEEKNTFDTAVKSFEEEKHIFLLSRLLGVVYQAGGPVTRRPTKRKISFKNKHCLALLLFLNCFIFFSQRKPHQKHEKGKIESGRCIRALWRARQDQRPHWQIYQKEKTPGRFKRCIQITFQCPLFVL